MIIFKKTLRPNGARVLLEFTLKDSATFTVGDALELASGKLDLAGAGGLFAGVLVAIRKADGSPVTDNGAGANFTDTYTTPSSNTVVGVIDVSLESVYSAKADAVLGTTAGSNLAGYNLDLVASSDELDESTAVTTTAQFFSLGPDPEAPTTRLLVVIQESQFKI